VNTRPVSRGRSYSSDKRASRRPLIICLLLAIAVLAAGSRIKPFAELGSPIYTPVDSWVSGAVDTGISFVSTLSNIPHLQEENSQLKRRVGRLNGELAKLPLYRSRDRALSQMNNVDTLNPHLLTQAARVIGYDNLGVAQTVTVDAGSDDGVRTDNPVFDPEGNVIGKVVSVAPAQSTVGLLTAADIAIPALDAETNTPGVLRTPSTSGPRLADVITGQRLVVGDDVVTSGLHDEFPLGSYIGKITAVHSTAFGALEYATVRTAANLNSLEYVQVVLNFPARSKVRYPSPTH
jgi:rod shape-determining protein MreC